MRRILVLAVAMVVLALAAPASAGGATQISGVGLFDGVFGDRGDCDGTGTGSWDLAISISGDLNGCLYQTFVDGAFRPGGAYFEVGTEVFVGCLGTKCGTFDTTYVFSGEYEEIANFDTEIFGRCQHPIVGNSGTADFLGATGRLDFKDVIVRDDEGNVTDVFFPMRGHIDLAG